MQVPCAVYFDDYPMLSPKSLAEETDGMVSEFLDLLGWRHDRIGPKGQPFGCSFDVLGMTLTLADLPTRKKVIVQNKVGRVEKISQKIETIRRAGVLTLAEAQELHGLLNFATGYFAGRFLKYACFKIFTMIDRGEAAKPKLSQWCEDVLTL